MTKNKIYLFGGIGLALLLAVAVWFYWQQQSTIQQLTAQFDVQKQELEREYEDLSIQYDEFNQSMSIKNDSLSEKLSQEKTKVTRLLEELRSLKATNAANVARINQLQAEIKNLRVIMREFVIQIDSLNRLNQQLVEENTAVKAKIQRVTEDATQLSKEKEQLAKKVEQASLLDAVNINARPLDRRNRQTKSIRSMETIKIDFLIAKNITAKVGERYVYAQIYKPDGEVLVKNRSDQFKYENKNLPFSCRKAIIFDGEEQAITLYWKVEEYLNPGDYRIEIFADDNNIGSKVFKLEK